MGITMHISIEAGNENKRTISVIEYGIDSGGNEKNKIK
jgi:hypothetical protein